MRSALPVWQRSRRRTGELQQGGEMPRCVTRNNHHCVALLDTGVAMAAIHPGVSQLHPPNRTGIVAAVEQQDRHRMFEPGAGECRRIRVPGNYPRYRQVIERDEFGLDQRCQRGIGLMHEPTGRCTCWPT